MTTHEACPSSSALVLAIVHIIRINPGRRITVDMAGIPLLSSRLANEVFVKLSEALGSMFVDVSHSVSERR